MFATMLYENFLHLYVEKAERRTVGANDLADLPLNVTRDPGSG